MKFNPGDIIKCIGMNSNYGSKLEIGTLYTVRESVKGDSNWLRVMEKPDNPNANPEITRYEVKYFEPYKVPSPVQKKIADSETGWGF